MKLFRNAVPLILALLCHYQAKAVLVMHEWLQDHRGYSIELRPGTGTGGVPAEYVAAGTVYEAGNARYGWHFMHLDANGNIVTERTTWPNVPNQVEFRVVDIACQNTAEFWITIQARDIVSLNRDYIYLAGIDITGSDLPMPRHAIAIQSIDMSHKNLYPTHSYYAGNSLYICGYAAGGTEYPNEPDAHYSDKWGMMLRCDVNAATPATACYFWNTTNPGNQDFDMALKIAPNSHGQTFPLLVTGAVNTDDEWVSGVLAAKVDASGFPSTLKGLVPFAHYYTPVPNRPAGVYGVDVRGGVKGGYDAQSLDDLDNDNVILVNYFDEQNPEERTYGIIRAHNNFDPYGITVNSYKYVVEEHEAWGKQFLEMHGYEGQSGNYSPNQIDNHTYIVGEQFDFLDICAPTLPSGALSPSLTNINPFIRLCMVGAGWWSYNTGFIALSEPNPMTYLSSLGTTSSSMNYLPGSLGAGALREDITRLHTFASIGHFYDDPTVVNPPEPDPAMVLPIGSTGTAWLSTKFLGIQAGSLLETSCEQQRASCDPMDYSIVLNQTEFTRPGFVDPTTTDAYWYFTILPYMNQIPPTYDCTEGRYKPTAVALVEGNSDLRIYPNPASDELNIRVDANSGQYSFSLADITGKEIRKTEGDIAGANINVKLPSLTAGMYIATITINGETYTEKVSIR